MVTALVVDDSAVDRRLAGMLLSRAGFELRYAENGAEALSLIEESPPEIVVTDMQMPEMDGLALVREVRARGVHVPVILMTAHGSEEIAVKALQGGAASYVPKRSLAHDLVATVENVIELGRAARASLRVLSCLDHIETRFLIDNDASAIPVIVGHLESDLTRLALCDETALIQVGVALREALVNAIHHGNLELSSTLREMDGGRAYQELAEQRRRELPYRLRRVRVLARITRYEVTYVVADEGPGFDPSKLPNPTDPAQLERVSGRGLLLIRTFMDEVRHNERGNEITLIKRLRSPSYPPPRA
ncbi:Sigma-54 dependent transcriptional regulator [Minicystis rosea]|nr:Sigma-54 dependent transcriptional regulator [Minicystis rosea]